MPKYAEKTTVSAARTRADIEDLLIGRGATGYGIMRHGAIAAIVFELEGRQVRIGLQLPDPDSDAFKYTQARRIERSPTEQQKAYEQAERQKWRALYAVIKAKLIAVEEGISTVEREFFYDIVTPTGQTLGEITAPALAEAYTRKLPVSIPELIGG